MKWCNKYPTIPVVRKCCFCVPVRKGVILFGYIHLKCLILRVLALLAMPALIFVITEDITSSEVRSLSEQVHVRIALAFLLADIITYIVLLVGAHKRNKCILKGYLYFSLLFQMISVADLVYFEFRNYIENAVYFIFLSMNLYLMLLVYSTIRVMEESSVHYVAHQNLR